MGFDRAFHAAATYASPPDLDGFRKHIDAAWIEQALAATGTATVRRRRLPSEQVIWVVLGMGLFRDRPIEDIVSKLDLALPGPSATVARSTVSQARDRVGSEPLRWLFERSASTWSSRSAEAHLWRGLRLYGMDGSTIRVPDTPENRAAFGGQRARSGSVSGYPMVRLVVLMALRSHLLAAAHFGRYEGSYELECARSLYPSIPPASLTVVDRLYFTASVLLGIEAGGNERHWLTRARSNLSARVVKRFGAGDELIEMEVSSQARKKDTSLPRHWQARRIRYKRPGFREQWLLTSLRDPETYPATEVVSLYHERWELELGYDEIKTELLEREEAIRSKKPDGVLQELWGVLLAYNLVRLEMESIAREAKIEPTRISFVEALRLMRDEWGWLSVASPGAIPKRLAAMRRSLKRYVLPPRRPRRFPRAVKLKMSNYDRKRPLAERA
jgi:Insertion element 4 transposase N-terminal/Transposase DDE domain